MKILIVDDSRQVASFVGMCLEFEGYEVKTALNGAEGYSAYLHFRPDLVITDIQMPEENGFELMNHIREKDPEVKTIYMSGNLEEFYPLIEKEENMYPIQVLNKPFSKEELVGQVTRFSG